MNKITGGVVTFGDVPPPIKIHEGPTARKKIKSPAASSATGPGEQGVPSPPERGIASGEEGKSLGNVGRGDWTSIGLFRRAAAGIEPHVRRLIILYVQHAPPPH